MSSILSRMEEKLLDLTAHIQSKALRRNLEVCKRKEIENPVALKEALSKHLTLRTAA